MKFIKQNYRRNTHCCNLCRLQRFTRQRKKPVPSTYAEKSDQLNWLYFYRPMYIHRERFTEPAGPDATTEYRYTILSVGTT